MKMYSFNHNRKAIFVECVKLMASLQYDNYYILSENKLAQQGIFKKIQEIVVKTNL